MLFVLEYQHSKKQERKRKMKTRKPMVAGNWKMNKTVSFTKHSPAFRMTNDDILTEIFQHCR